MQNTIELSDVLHDKSIVSQLVENSCNWWEFKITMMTFPRGYIVGGKIVICCTGFSNE